MTIESLVHVCQLWKTLVLESPRRLNLRLYYTPETPEKDTLDIWPALPLIVLGYDPITDGQHHCSTWAEQSRLSGLPLGPLELAIGKRHGRDAGLIPRVTELWLSSDGETMPVICQSCFYPLLTLSTFTFITLLTPGTSHSRQSSFSSLCCPASNHFTLNPNLLNLALTAKLDVVLHQTILSSLL